VIKVPTQPLTPSERDSVPTVQDAALIYLTVTLCSLTSTDRRVVAESDIVHLRRDRFSLVIFPMVYRRTRNYTAKIKRGILKRNFIVGCEL
jgi:hypothetical protein